MAAVLVTASETLSATTVAAKQRFVFCTTTERLGAGPLGFFYLLNSYSQDPAPDFPTTPGYGLSNPYVDGVLCRETWNQLVLHNYNTPPIWTWFLDKVNRTLASGRKVGIEILAGNFAPTQFYTDFPDETILLSHGGNSTCVWGPNFLRLWESLNRQLAALVTNFGPLGKVASYVKLIGVGATSESFFIHQADPGMTADLAAANASATTLGYTDSGDGQGAAAAAWRIMAPKLVDMYARVWPTVPFMLGTGAPWPVTAPYTGDEMLQTLVNYGLGTYPGRFGVRNDALDQSADAGPGPLLVAQAAATCVASGFQYARGMSPSLPSFFPFTDGVANGTTTYTSNTANFKAGDVTKLIQGTFIPAGTTIATRVSATTITLSNAATGSGTGLSFGVENTGGGNDPNPPHWVDLSVSRAIATNAHLIEFFTPDLDLGMNPTEWGPDLGVLLAKKRPQLPALPVSSLDIATRILVAKRATAEPFLTASLLAVGSGAGTPGIATTTEAPRVAESVIKLRAVARTASETLTVSDSAKVSSLARTTTEGLGTSMNVATALTGSVSIWKTTLFGDTQLDPGWLYPFTLELDERGTFPFSYAIGKPPELTIRPPSGGLVLYNDGAFGWYNPFQTVFGWGISVTATESLHTAESVSRSTLSLAFTATDHLVIFEDAHAVLTPYGVDHLVVSENAVALFGQAAFVSDALTISQSVVAVRGVIRSLTDHPQIIESVSRLLVLFRSAAETLAIAEVVLRNLGLHRFTTEFLSISVSASPIHPLSVVTSDALNISEVVRKTGVFNRQVFDAINADQIASTFGDVLFRSTSESLHSAEVVRRLLALGRTTQEALTIALLAARHADVHRFTAELLSILELLERSGAPRFRSTAEFLHIAELLDQLRIAGPFIYLLPFPSGNLPMVSTLDTPLADSELLNVVTDSQLSVPLADCNLIGFVAQSALGHEQAISTLQNVTTGSSLNYVQP